MLSDPYSLIAILFFAFVAVLIWLCILVERVQRLEYETLRLRRAEAKREALVNKLERELFMVDENHQEVPVPARRSS